MSKITINENEELVKLDNIRIRDREMIPEVIIATNKVTETMKDPEGNVIGVTSSIVRTSSITLRPEEHYKTNKRKRNAEENASKIKKTGK